MSASFALASLTENYTDSEGEESHHYEEVTTVELATSGGNSQDSKSESFVEVKTTVVTNHHTVTTNNIVVTDNAVSNLVSYHDDTVLSDDEHFEKIVTQGEEEEEPIEDVELPPEPQGRCSNELQEKISKLHDEMVLKGLDMNMLIQKRKDFRNPSIYEKLIQFCGINEFGTNYSPEIYDPLKWGKSSYYDELAKVQKAEMDQKEKERREKTKVEFLMGTAKKATGSTGSSGGGGGGGAGAEEEAAGKRRKSKWDQVGPPLRPPTLLTLPPVLQAKKPRP